MSEEPVVVREDVDAILKGIFLIAGYLADINVLLGGDGEAEADEP